MKRCSFKVAKAIKEAGYPQHSLNEVTPLAYDDNGEIWEMGYFDQNPYLEYYSIVTYLDVWLWLWREKLLYIQVVKFNDGIFKTYVGDCYCGRAETKDPEEAIKVAIEYLAENNLIK